MADVEIAVTLRLFGSFRRHGDTIGLSLPPGGTAAQVKERLARILPPEDAGLVRESVLADEHEIIGDDAVLSRDTVLAILPPVCGG